MRRDRAQGRDGSSGVLIHGPSPLEARARFDTPIDCWSLLEEGEDGVGLLTESLAVRIRGMLE